ncbi:unnamed protein product [Coffea canephora]|uniref:DH200=94 genomic scaffold, scaffold_325 n=1 Tax=Coffea canephora TaxID=49390 RepID=A0A068VE52_COFCA|nr:unnamed protein product [Coffea canephora]
MLKLSNDEKDIPKNLEGGNLLDQPYAMPPKDLNMLLFTPKSQLMRDLAELQGTTDVQEGPWTRKSADKSCLVRVITYTKAVTKLVKAVKATEEQTYIKANGKEFIVFVDVNTPEVPYGNTFKVDLLYKITPGPKLSCTEKSAHLVVSWAINFHQNTMMKGMIEGGARQGLKESFEQLSDLLAKILKVINPINVSDCIRISRHMDSPRCKICSIFSVEVAPENFLDNTNGAKTIRDYLNKIEKEVGKKLNLQSPHRNSAFQKISGLPPKEFLISDFSRSLKRKMPLQGQLFLSARIVGFYANLFGHKPKFFIPWENIEHIHELFPSLGTVESPSLVIILSMGRGNDTRRQAAFLFSFIHFLQLNANRTVMVVWTKRKLGPDQRAQIAEEQQDRD